MILKGRRREYLSLETKTNQPRRKIGFGALLVALSLSHAWAELDRDLQTMSLQVERSGGQKPMVAVGFRWTDQLGSMLDDFQHVGSSAK